MSFSFNWSGLDIPQISGGDTTQMASQSASLFGSAARGADRMVADREYAGILRGNSAEARQRLAELKAELSRLQARNEEIRSLIGKPQTPVQPNLPVPQTPVQPTSPQGYPYRNDLG